MDYSAGGMTRRGSALLRSYVRSSSRDSAKSFKGSCHICSMIDDKLLEILACPKCKGTIRLEGDRLICDACKLAYPIREGIPVMLIDEAEKLT